LHPPLPADGLILLISISPLWVGVFVFGTQKIDIGAAGPFRTFVDSKNVGFDKKMEFGEIDVTNDRLRLKINVNPTSWEYSCPLGQAFLKTSFLCIFSRHLNKFPQKGAANRWG
jgi:hypothetical protein